MKPPRRTKPLLSGEDLHLWSEIAKLITPLRGRAVSAKPKSLAVAEPAQKSAPTRPTKAETLAFTITIQKPSTKRPLKLTDLAPSTSQPAKPAFLPVRPALSSSPGLERKERRALQRGILPIEARIDLHGLYQAQAHAALIGFIIRSRADGHARVLVVTGKGGEETASFSGRGVLRRSVPHWLRGPDLRGIVLGFEEAGRQHGGSGALYVRLKRR